MPSSDDYVRDYKQEKKTSDARGEKPKRAARNRARRVMTKAGMVKKGDGKDVDHKTALSKGGSETSRDNLRALPAGKNRSFKRNSDGSMK
jgi:hypothetical protein